MACILCLVFIYNLKMNIPRDHHYYNSHYHHTKFNTRRKVKEEALYADFMEQVGTRMLQVDAWEQKMAWQRLQNDLLLRREVGDLIGGVVKKKRDGVFVGDDSPPEFSLTDLYLHEDIDAAANRKEREKHIRSMEDRLVDRVHAAFALAPDLPKTYDGVQVPYSLEEFRDYIIGYSHSEHRKFKNELLLEEVKGKRREKIKNTDALLSDFDDTRSMPHRDYILWASRKYMKYSRFRKYDDDSSEDEFGPERLAGTDYEASDPNRFKMYPSAVYNLGGSRVKDADGDDEKKSGNI